MKVRDTKQQVGRILNRKWVKREGEIDGRTETNKEKHSTWERVREKKWVCEWVGERDREKWDSKGKKRPKNNEDTFSFFYFYAISLFSKCIFLLTAIIFTIGIAKPKAIKREKLTPTPTAFLPFPFNFNILSSFQRPFSSPTHLKKSQFSWPGRVPYQNHSPPLDLPMSVINDKDHI